MSRIATIYKYKDGLIAIFNENKTFFYIERNSFSEIPELPRDLSQVGEMIEPSSVDSKILKNIKTAVKIFLSCGDLKEVLQDYFVDPAVMLNLERENKKNLQLHGLLARNPPPPMLPVSELKKIRKEEREKAIKELEEPLKMVSAQLRDVADTLKDAEYFRKQLLMLRERHFPRWNFIDERPRLNGRFVKREKFIEEEEIETTPLVPQEIKVRKEIPEGETCDDCWDNPCVC